MKTNILLLGVAITLLTASSCSTIRWSARDTASMNVTKSGIYTKPKVADLKIENIRATGSSAGDIKEKSIETIKAEALQNALRASQADILVEPIYEVERNGGTVSARVTGFPAKIIGFKEISPDDTLAFNLANKIVVQKTNPCCGNANNNMAIQNEIEAQERKRRHRRAIGLGVGLGVLLPIGLGLGLGLGLNGY